MRCRQLVSFSSTCLLYLVLIVATTTTSTTSVWAKKDRNVPHHHSGSLKPYDAGPFELKLDDSDEKELASGKPVMKQSEGDLGGGAICVQDVEAPKEAVWAQILDLDSYKGKVNKVNECKNYFMKNNGDGTTTVKTKMVLGVLPGYSVRFFFVFRSPLAKMFLSAFRHLEVNDDCRVTLFYGWHC